MTDRELSFGSSEPDFDAETVASFVRRLDELWDEDTSDQANILPSFRDRLLQDYGSAFDRLARVHAAAVEAASWSATAMDEYIAGVYADASSEEGEAQRLDEYEWLMRGLGSRSLLAFAEVTWLAQGGYPNGALARVRTMHQLAITAAVLAEYGNPDAAHPELVRRFSRHREVFYPDTAKKLVASSALGDDPFDAETLGLIAQRQRELIAEFGAEFRGAYGWAQPLFAPGERISFTKLANLVEPKLAILYSITSSHVHADSEGWHHGLIKFRDEDVFAAGPTNLGLALPTSIACRLLLACLDLVVPATIKVDEKKDTDGALLMTGVRHVVEQALAAMEAAEAAVKLREEELETESAGAQEGSLD
jgi:hypothetical protein